MREPIIDERFSVRRQGHRITAFETLGQGFGRPRTVGRLAVDVEGNAWPRGGRTRGEEQGLVVRSPNGAVFISGSAGRSGEGFVGKVEGPDIIFLVIGTDGDLLAVRGKPGNGIGPGFGLYRLFMPIPIDPDESARGRCGRPGPENQRANGGDGEL